MATKYKAINYIDRCKNPDHCIKFKITRRKRFQSVSVPKVDEQLQRVFYTSQDCPVDNRKTMSKYKYSDFCLENLQATGAIDSMSQCSMSGDVFTSINNIESHCATLDNSFIESNINS